MAELSATMTADEFTDWIAFDQLSPIGGERLDCQIRQTAMHEAVSVLIGICDSFGPGVKSQVAHQCLYAVKTLLADEQRHAHSIGGNIVGHDHSKDEAKG